MEEHGYIVALDGGMADLDGDLADDRFSFDHVQ
jgi:hypothetical protein